MSAFFHASYFESRGRFRALADEHGGCAEAYPIRARGPAGEELTIDTAYFGNPKPERLLILMSGTHGVEGFAGSACQLEFLSEDFSRGDLAAGDAVLLVHAVNPYGFAWVRRVNEHNVDLNRNFLDHDANAIRRPAYVDFDPLLNPQELTEATESAFVARVFAEAEEKSVEYVQAVFTEGQYECPQGIYYGGAAPEESNVLLRHIYREWVRPAARALMIDFHTGLGEWGDYTILSDHERESAAHRTLIDVFGAARVECTLDGTSISAPLAGEIGRGIMREIPDVVWTSCACEFGTYDGLRVLQALRRENWVHHHGDRNRPEDRLHVEELREVFNPDSDDWRRLVLAGGRRCIADAWRGIFGG